MKDRQIEHKVINGLLKQGYHPYYILGLVCDYGFYLGVKGTQFEVPL